MTEVFFYRGTSTRVFIYCTVSVVYLYITAPFKNSVASSLQENFLSVNCQLLFQLSKKTEYLCSVVFFLFSQFSPIEIINFDKNF